MRRWEHNSEFKPASELEPWSTRENRSITDRMLQARVPLHPPGHLARLYNLEKLISDSHSNSSSFQSSLH